MAGQGQSGHRHFIVSAVIAGLVFQAVMVAVMLPMPLVMSAALAGSIDPAAIVICTPSGMKLVSFDASGNPIEETAPGCPVCDALAAVAIAMPGVDASTPAPLAAADAGCPAGEHLFSSVACLAHNNRDPPALA